MVSRPVVIASIVSVLIVACASEAEDTESADTTCKYDNINKQAETIRSQLEELMNTVKECCKDCSQSTHDTPDEPDEADKPDKPDKPDKADEEDKPNKADKPDKADKEDKPGEPGEPDKPDKPDEADKADEADEPNEPNEQVVNTASSVDDTTGNASAGEGSPDNQSPDDQDDAKPADPFGIPKSISFGENREVLTKKVCEDGQNKVQSFLYPVHWNEAEKRVEVALAKENDQTEKKWVAARSNANGNNGKCSEIMKNKRKGVDPFIARAKQAASESFGMNKKTISALSSSPNGFQLVDIIDLSNKDNKLNKIEGNINPNEVTMMAIYVFFVNDVNMIKSPRAQSTRIPYMTDPDNGKVWQWKTLVSTTSTTNDVNTDINIADITSHKPTQFALESIIKKINIVDAPTTDEPADEDDATDGNQNIFRRLLSTTV